jgi:hypothetical protein
MNCAPLSNGAKVYVHHIVMTPVYTKPPGTDVRRQTFYNLLHDQTESIAILSSKPWPEVSISLLLHGNMIYLFPQQTITHILKA